MHLIKHFKRIYFFKFVCPLRRFLMYRQYTHFLSELYDWTENERYRMTMGE